MDPKDYFERVFVVNLDRRPERWERLASSIPHDWPFVLPERVVAIDGQKCPPPEWWKQGGGAWGCFRSHFRLIEHCLNSGIHSVLLLEDDAYFPVDFTGRVTQFLEQVPNDWDMIYLGGQHLFAKKHPPIRVNEWVYRPYNVNRTHAFALRGRMLRIVYHHLLQQKWLPRNHIDHHLGRLHQRRAHNIYCPVEWVIGQADGRSDISGRSTPTRLWTAAEALSNINPEDALFVAVIGLHSSGSSCMAGVLYHLGIHMGNTLGGFYGRDPDAACGFEAAGLARLCEKAIPFPNMGYVQPRGDIWASLKKWIDERRWEAVCKGTIAGGKYPQLCRLGKQLLSICGERLRVVHISRPIEESIRSLLRRSGGRHSTSDVEAHQRWLFDGKQQFLATVPHVTVEYEQLLSDPRTQIERVIQYLQIKPDEARVAKALAYVQPSKRHVSVA